MVKSMESNPQKGVKGFAQLLELAKVLHLTPRQRVVRAVLSQKWDEIATQMKRNSEIGL
jgi:hypothetical protein